MNKIYKQKSFAYYQGYSKHEEFLKYRGTLSDDEKKQFGYDKDLSRITLIEYSENVNNKTDVIVTYEFRHWDDLPFEETKAQAIEKYSKIIEKEKLKLKQMRKNLNILKKLKNTSDE